MELASKLDVDPEIVDVNNSSVFCRKQVKNQTAKSNPLKKGELLNYFKLYSEGRFKEAVNSIFTEDAAFWNTRISLSGRQKIIDWLYASHQGYREVLTPTSFIIEPGMAAVELEQKFLAAEDISQFFIRPMKKDEDLKTRGILMVLKFKDGKICSSKEYRLLYQCDPELFMNNGRK